MQTGKDKGSWRLPLVRFDIQDKLALGIAAVFTTAAAIGLTFVHRSMTDSLDRMYEESAYDQATRVMSPLTNDVPPWIARSSTNTPQSKLAVALRYSGVILLALAAVVLLAMMAMVRWIVVSPIRALTRNIGEIGASADLTRRTALPQDDEIGILSREFDMMLDRLANARRSLMAYSFLAGAENAAVRTLHDVGNAATPVTVSLDLLSETLADMNVAAVSKRVSELRTETDAARRDALAGAIAKDIAQMTEAIARARMRLDVAVEQCRRMDSLIRASSGISARIPPAASVSPRDLVSTAVAMLPAESSAGITVELDDSLDSLPPITGAHPGLYAVFLAILTNAVEAIRGKGPGGIIRASGRRNADGTISIAITDDGTGIATAHLPSLFERDFTTKGRRKSMFSLHHCANVVAASRGEIKVGSEGADKGATVTVTLRGA